MSKKGGKVPSGSYILVGRTKVVTEKTEKVADSRQNLEYNQKNFQMEWTVAETRGRVERVIIREKSRVISRFWLV